MKNIVIYSSQEDWIIPLVSAPGEFAIQVVGQPSFSGSPDCVLLSQQYAGKQLSSLIAQFREFRIPCAVVTTDPSTENQQHLLAKGADDVITAPICADLLRRRIKMLTEQPASSDSEMTFAAFDRIMESNQGTGYFIVAEHDFLNIYRFVSRLLERLEQKAQLILFRFHSDDGPFIEADGALHFLKIVQASLRRGDISCNNGKQVLVILMGTDEPNARMVANRIIGAFNAHYNMDESCDVTYEIREISKAGNGIS